MSIRVCTCGAAGKRVRAKPRTRTKVGGQETTESLALLQKLRARQRKKGLQTQRNRKGRFVKQRGEDGAQR